MDSKKLDINLKIGEKKFSMKINRNEEEKIRQAGELAQKQYLKYKKAFGDSSSEDILAMAIFDLAKQNIDCTGRKESPELFLELSDIINELGDYLKAQ